MTCSPPLPSRPRLAALAAAALLLASAPARAVPLQWSGELPFHNSVALIDFTLDTDLERAGLWTDSFERGTNFDPIVALWQPDGQGDFTRLAQNDDNPTLRPEDQTYRDAGLLTGTLRAGPYRVSVSVFPNFANGLRLGEGFNADDQAPIPVAQWQDGSGPLWRLHLDGGFTGNPLPPPIPEPGTAALMLGGLGLLGWLRRRRGPG